MVCPKVWSKPGPKFYALPRISRIKNDLKKAGRAEYDIAVNAVLKMVGAHIGQKKRQEEQVLFAIGLGDFNTNKISRPCTLRSGSTCS
jgi:hypothetical protein